MAAIYGRRVNPTITSIFKRKSQSEEEEEEVGEELKMEDGSSVTVKAEFNQKIIRVIYNGRTKEAHFVWVETKAMSNREIAPRLICSIKLPTSMAELAKERGTGRAPGNNNNGGEENMNGNSGNSNSNSQTASAPTTKLKQKTKKGKKGKGKANNRRPRKGAGAGANSGSNNKNDGQFSSGHRWLPCVMISRISGGNGQTFCRFHVEPTIHTSSVAFDEQKSLLKKRSMYTP